jgi:hypothetical protein
MSEILILIGLIVVFFLGGIARLLMEIRSGIERLRLDYGRLMDEQRVELTEITSEIANLVMISEDLSEPGMDADPSFWNLN